MFNNTHVYIQVTRFQSQEKQILIAHSSSGTAFVLGSHPLAPPHNHFWEVTVDSPVYGTDVMVGVATGAAPLASGQRSYCSLLGREAESWGWSYQGYTQVSDVFCFGLSVTSTLQNKSFT